jgi:hypothetical protein
MILTILSALMGVAALFFGNLDNFWALFVIATGAYIIYNAMRTKKA